MSGSKLSFGAALGAIGVVYGDIGTSPLYAFREAVAASGPVTRETVLGVLSLILWALIVVVTLKYVLILLRADNHGEGGTLTLMALAKRAVGKNIGAVALFGHAHMLRILLARWLGLASLDGRLFKLETASISVLGYEHKPFQPVIRLWDDAGHAGI